MTPVRLILPFLVFGLMCPQVALAVNQVEVESKAVNTGATGVPIAVWLTNDVTVFGVVVPLVIREVTPGAFITSLGMTFADRLASPTVLALRADNQYAEQNGSCAPYGGFGTLTFNDGGPHPVAASPEGLLLAAVKSTGTELPAGTDATGSMQLTVDVTGTAGSFEIDTTCVNPANHLGFVNAASELIAPQFIKGEITVNQPSSTSIIVESKTVEAGATGVPIAIRLSNDASVRTVIVPIALRELTPGSFITSLQMSFAERLATPTVLDVRSRNQYADDNASVCPAGGFGAVTFTDGGPNAVIASPEGVMMAGTRLIGSDLPAGADVSGSMILTVDVSSTPGSFEIDTVCVDPANHCGFWDATTNTLIVPDFTKGVITIAPSPFEICYQDGGVYATGSDPNAVAAADFDGDGDRDLAVANWESDNVSVLMNSGDGSFAAPVNYPGWEHTVHVIAADLDHDDDMDLVTVEQDSSTAGRVGILKNQGSGTFTPATWYTVQDQPKWVAAAFFNMDNHLDLVVANSYSDNVSVLMNNGSGAFPSSATYLVGDQPTCVAAADLDWDGDFDLAVSNSSSHNVSILKNNGNGTFSGAVNYSAGLFPMSVVASPLDSDSDYDLAVANSISGQVSILKNDGSGAFESPSSYATQSGPIRLCAADLNGDGANDLAVATLGSNSISLLKNDGAGTFAAPVNLATGNGPATIVADFLDDNGTLDLAVPCAWSDHVNILLNCGAVSTPGYTPAGTDVTLDLGSGITVTFSSVTTPGQTSAVTNLWGPPLPGGYALPADMQGYFDIQTTSTFSGPVTICRSYNDNILPYPSMEGYLNLFHYYYIGGTFYADMVLSSRDMVNNILCCVVYSLSPFLIAYPTCSCPSLADLDGNDFIDAVDLAVVIDIVFFGTSDTQDPACPATRADFNNDGFADAVDLAFLIDHVFFGGSGPVDPCAP